MKKRLAIVAMALLTLAGCSTARKAAEPATVKLSEADQRRYDLCYMEAQNQQQQEHYDVAFDLLLHCLDICPTAPSALHGLAQYYDYMGDKERSLTLMKQAVQYDPENYWYQEDLAQTYYNNSQPGLAVEIYEDMYRRFPRRAASLLPILITLYEADKQYDKELEALEALEERFGASEETGMEKFRAYMAMDDEEGAFAELEKMVEDNPGDTRLELMLAELYMNVGAFDKAQQRFLSVLDEEPENDNAHFGLAQWHEKTGHHADANALLDSLVVYGHLPDEQRIKIVSQLVAEWEQKGDTLAIDDLFNRILEMPLDNVSLPQAIAGYYIDKGRSDTYIIPVLDEILYIEHDNISALKQCLYYAVQHNDTEEVQRRSRELLAYYPDELYPYYYLVITALRDDDDYLAIHYAKEGISRIDDESDTELCILLYSMLGDLYIEKKQNDEGYACYDSALVYNPAEVSVLNNYAYNLCLEGRDLSRAEEMSRITIEKEPANSTYLDTYAWILFTQQRYMEALQYTDEALRCDTTESWVLQDHAGDIIYYCGSKEVATGHWKEALRLLQASYGDAEPSIEDRRAEEKLKKKIRLKKALK